MSVSRSVPRVAPQSFSDVGRSGAMYYVYILQLHDGSFYIGYSFDLKQRLVEHQKGYVISTKHNLPPELIWYSAFRLKNKAIAFEKYMKSSSGFAFRNKHLI